MTEIESFLIEEKAIRKAGLRTQGGLLVNTSYGGEGSSGCDQPKTKEHRQAIANAKKGKKLSTEHRKALSIAKKGRVKISPETRAKISKALEGRTPSAEHRKNLSISQKGGPKNRETNL